MVMRNGQTLMGDAACAVRLKNGMMDTGMICHPEFNVCMLTCDTTFDCPAAWVCDERAETLMATAPAGSSGPGPAICVNPTCGDSSD
jgi:hypothetical protein